MSKPLGDFEFENVPDDCPLCGGSGIAPDGAKTCYACSGSGYNTPFNDTNMTTEPTYNVTPRLDKDAAVFGLIWVVMLLHTSTWMEMS